MCLLTPQRNALLWSRHVLGWVQRNSNFGSLDRRLEVANCLGRVRDYLKKWPLAHRPFDTFQAREQKRILHSIDITQLSWNEAISLQVYFTHLLHEFIFADHSHIGLHVTCCYMSWSPGKTTDIWAKSTQCVYFGTEYRQATNHMHLPFLVAIRYCRTANIQAAGKFRKFRKFLKFRERLTQILPRILPTSMKSSM